MTIHWGNGAGGVWSKGTNWVGNAVPGAGSDVAIDATPTGTGYTVTLDINASVDTLSLIAAATLLVSGGTLTDTGGTGSGANDGTILVSTGALTIDGTFDNLGLLEATSSGALSFAGVTLVQTPGGTLEVTTYQQQLINDDIKGGEVLGFSGGSFATVSGDSATLDGSTSNLALAATVTIADNSSVVLLGTINTTNGTLDTQAINNTADVVISGNVTLTGDGRIVLGNGSNNLLTGANAGTLDTLTNVSATISGGGDIGGGTLALTNEAAGVINANAATAELLIASLAGAFVNHGLVEATAAGGLLIQSTTIANTGGTILANGGGVVTLESTDIQGGSVAGLGGGVVTVGGNYTTTLDGSAASVTTTGVITVVNQSQLNVLGSIVNKGTLLLGAQNYQSDLILSGATTTLSGGGQVQLDGNNNAIIEGAATSDLLVNAGDTIIGGGLLGNGAMALDNRAGGVIDAAGTSDALTVTTTAASMSNEGLMEDTGTAGLVLAGITIANTGTIEANGIGAHVDLTGNTTIKGGVLATPVVTIGSATGSGVVQVDFGNAATLDGSAGSLTNLGTFEVDNDAAVSLLGTIVNSGTILLADNNYGASLYADSPSTTLTGGGQVVLVDDPNGLIQGVATTVDSVVTVYSLVNVNNTIAGAGALGGGQINFDNQTAGTIDADGANALVINVGAGNTFTNEGLLETTLPVSLATTGGLVIQGTTINNTGSGNAGVLLANGNTIHLQGNSDIKGGTLQTANGGVVQTDFANAATLDGSAAALTNKGTLVLANDATVYTLGAIVNSGSIVIAAANYATYLVVDAATVTLSGAGQVLMADTDNSIIVGAAGTDKLVNVNNTISGSGQIGGGAMALDNQAKGVIDATGASTALTLDLTGLTNEGLVEVTGPAGLVIAGTTVTNTGTIEANGIGTQVDLTGGTDIKGGVLATPVRTVGSVTGAGVVQVAFANAATLDGSTSGITNLGTFVVDNDGLLNLLGTITNDGSIIVAAGNYSTTLEVGAPLVTLTGGGQVQLYDTSNSVIVGAAATDKLVNVNDTISGSGQFGDGRLSVSNEVGGIIDADGATTALTISTGGGSFINAGRIETTSAAGLTIYASRITNTGSILAAGAGTHVDLTGGAEIVGGTVGSTGGGVVVADFGNNATLDGPGVMTLLGTVEAGNDSTLALIGTFSISGVLAVAATNYATVLQIDSATVALRGGGQVLLADIGNSVILGAAATDTLVNVNDTISGSGQFGDGQLSVDNQAGGIIDATGSNAGMTINTGAGTFTNEGRIEDTGPAGLTIASKISNTGSILAAGSAAYIGLVNGSDIAGGTFGSTGGGVAAVNFGNAGTLDGTSTITTIGTVEAFNDAVLDVLGSVVNKGTLLVAAGNYTTYLVIASPTVTLTGGGSVVMADSGNSAFQGVAAGDELVNVNNTISGSGQLGDGQLSIDNEASGIINANGVAAGMAINVGTGSFSNQGLIETTGTEGLAIYSTITNTGTIIAAGTLTGINLYTGDDIVGGTFGSTGGGVASVVFGNTGTLDGTSTITTIGTVVAGNDAFLDLLGTVVNKGTLVVAATNYTSQLVIASPTVTLSGGGSLAMNDTSNSFVEGASAADVLVNVNNTIAGAGNLGNNLLNITNDAAGMIDGNGNNQLTIAVGKISNAGLIEATGAGGVLLSESELSNFSSSGTVATLTGGSFTAINSTLTISGAGFATLAGTANLTETGTGQITIGGTDIDTMLTSVASGHKLAVLGGRNFQAAHAITIASGATLQLGGGTFSTTAGGITSAGHIVGYGSIATTGVATLNSTGLIEASGGLLKLGALSGAGTLQIDAGATLELPGATADGLTFNGINATLRLDKPATYTGTISGLAPGDRLDLAGVKIASAAFVGDSLVVTEQGGTKLTYALASAPASGDVIQVSSNGTVGVVTIYGLAQPGTITPTPISFGNRHAGAAVTQALTVSNLAPTNGYYEAIDAAIASTGTGVTTAGTLSGLGAGKSSTALTVKLNTATDGVMTGTVTVTETSDGTGIDGLPVTLLTTQTIQATGTVYAYAAPKFSTKTVKFAAERVGGAAQTLDVTLGNGSSADAFQESLQFAETGPGGIVGTVGSVGGTIVAGGSVTLGFALNTATSGSFAATPVVVGLTSIAGGTGLTSTTLAAGTISVTAQVYQTAVASLGTVVNFGIVHVGSTADVNLGVTNSATGALVDSLIGDVASITGAPVTASGSLNLAALAAGSLGFALNTGAAGVIAGTAKLSLSSHDSALANVAVATGTVTLTGTIDNYAQAALAQASGAGSFAAAGANTATLTIAAVKGTSASTVLQASNAAPGQADQLAGSFAVSGPGTAGYNNASLTSFSGLGAGQSASGKALTLTAAAIGYDVEQVVLNATGSNASGYSGAVAAQTLDVLGAVGNAVLTGTADTVSLTGNDTIVATSGALSAGDVINGGTGSNTLLLLGAGTFDLSVPTTLTKITTVSAMEGQAAYTPVGGTPIPNESQTLTLRSGLNVTVNVNAAPAVLLNPADPNPTTITIHGAADSSIINLGAGADTVYLGSATETVNGGTGSGSVYGTATTAGAKVVGAAGGGPVTLEIDGGGTARLNAADTHLTVALTSATYLALGTMAFVTAVGEASGNTIIAKAAGQTLGGLAGSDVLDGFSGFGDTFAGTSAGLNHDTINTFGGNDAIDVSDLLPSATLTYTGTTTKGTLTLSDGTHATSMTLVGNFSQNLFQVGTDHHSGALITYS